MAALAGEVSKQIKGHSEGEKGFRYMRSIFSINKFSKLLLNMQSLDLSSLFQTHTKVIEN